MIKQIDFKMLFATLVLVGGVIGMITGNIQNYIGFEDPLNEMVYTLMLIMGVIGCAMNIKK